MSTVGMAQAPSKRNGGAWGMQNVTAGSGAVLVYHTTAFPELRNCANSSVHRAHMLGRRPHFAQLNAAGRHVAQYAPTLPPPYSMTHGL